MRLANLVEEYIAFKQATGMCFESQARILKLFSRRLGPLEISHVTPKAVLAFLNRIKIITSSWHQTFSTLNGFYRYAITRQYVNAAPLPVILPKGPKYAPPYIYSKNEIRALLDSSWALDDNYHRRGAFSVTTFRTLLLLLYGTGLRISEALSLTMADINLPDNMLIVRNSKFFKSRLVPIGPKLTAVLQDYLNARRETYGPPQIDSVLFLNYKHTPLARLTAERYFRLVRQQAGIRRTDGAHYQPRLHDFRSTFAVHRLVTWYQQGADVQKLLPQLSTYLGHVHIANTQVYLTMTPELLREANCRFEGYALSEVNHAG
jgi:site-specific recombinase XerD